VREFPVAPSEKSAVLGESPAQSSRDDEAVRPRRASLYAFTIFASAFLLFQLQPLVAKVIVPWFGGAAAVWTTCLLFFQTFLLLSNVYAHGLARLKSGRAQAAIHLTLLAASLLFLPILPGPSWKPEDPSQPVLRALLLLTVSVGLPYFLLASTSPLLQAWYARSGAREEVYRFYALSNAGSLLALVSYPVVFEPTFAVKTQGLGWSAAYVLFALACGSLALRRRTDGGGACDDEAAPAPSRPTRILWVALAACGSALLLAVTHHLTQNLAAVPLLWVVPLSLYLLSFVLCFSGVAGYRRGIFLRLLAVALGGMAYALSAQFVNPSLFILIPLFCGGLFVGCMVCHGELARLKPHPNRLTGFYLAVSLGGALGGVFAVVVAPRLFEGFFELHVTLAACAVLVLLVLRRDPKSLLARGGWQPAWLAAVAVVLVLVASLAVVMRRQTSAASVMMRNFYGVLRVIDIEPVRIVLIEGETAKPLEAEPVRRKLMHGSIEHGLQFLGPEARREPTAYYGRTSGAGRTLAALARREKLHVGLVGLGVGTLAAYGRPGDRYRFYEINPQVVEAAREYFHYLEDSRAEIEIVLGDARLSLEREPPHQFDALLLDAFSSDAIPVHLLTREAFELYSRHLAPDGVLAVHISNHYLDLAPVVARQAEELGWNAVQVQNLGDEKKGIFRSNWVLLSRRADFFDQPEIREAATPLPPADVRLWTDDYSAVFGVLKWGWK
jgi:SAM-dependent methyltransferase